MTNIIKSAEYKHLVDSETVIEIEIKDNFKPALIDVYHADKITIWWTSDAGKYEDSVKIYAVEDVEDDTDMIDKVATWKKPDIKEALRYTKEFLT